jgi:hypothetical protein
MTEEAQTKLPWYKKYFNILVFVLLAIAAGIGAAFANRRVLPQEKQDALDKSLIDEKIDISNQMDADLDAKIIKALDTSAKASETIEEIKLADSLKTDDEKIEDLNDFMADRRR